ncbi:hypothetical protein E2C01_079217 [Portunus trituberculatus]|uniref:Uncharacterized protein n=1 Tax=Portunus trituberculatus TaxID=210409 RepID=A0A5B7ISQ7_PORTR|nr:hypothetical protein [Portunus trituberculatus]
MHRVWLLGSPPRLLSPPLCRPGGRRLLTLGSPGVIVSQAGVAWRPLLGNDRVVGNIPATRTIVTVSNASGKPRTPSPPRPTLPRPASPRPSLPILPCHMWLQFSTRDRRHARRASQPACMVRHSTRLHASITDT